MAQVDITTQVFPATHVGRISDSVHAQEGYDTFASSQHTRVRERTEREAIARPIIPGEIISEFVEGVSESIGRQIFSEAL